MTVLGSLFAALPALAADDAKEPTLPYYASMKFAETNMRVGPGKEYPINWVYHRKSLPVKVVDVHKEWRNVVDPYGDKGWVNRSQISLARSAVTRQDQITLHSNPAANAPGAARIDQGVVAKILSCSGSWCQVEVSGHRGWLDRSDLWGVSEDEVIDAK